jgi:uncharacterized caspase-like protein
MDAAVHSAVERKSVEDQRQNRRLMDNRKKLTYKAPKLKQFGDFRTLTLAKGAVDKDSATAPLRTRASGGPNA